MTDTIKDELTGCVFDDYVKQSKEYKKSHWTQVCKEHAKECHIPTKHLEEIPGDATCGVVGCENEADFYYDFNGKRLKLEKRR